MVERDKLREWEQKERRARELNPDLPGERPMSYPLDYEVFIQRDVIVSIFKLYFCLETRAKLETLPSKSVIMANLIYIALSNPILKFRETEMGFYKIVVRVKSYFKVEIIIMGFIVASRVSIL